MRKHRGWTYNCEYCRTHKHHKAAMERHEKHCTMNPNRECKMCDMIGEAPVKTEEVVLKLREKFSESEIELNYNCYTEEVLGYIRELCNGCPACMLSSLRIGSIYVEDFSFQEECQRFFKEYNREHGQFFI